MESDYLADLSGITYPVPLNEISTNVARVPYTTVAEPKKTNDAKVDPEDSIQWKVMLSPVTEESPSPHKTLNRRQQPLDPDMLARHSPHSQHCQNTPSKDLRLIDVSCSKQAYASPIKSIAQPLSPGSQKMQNFLKRLEKQGLSHD